MMRTPHVLVMVIALGGPVALTAKADDKESVAFAKLPAAVQSSLRKVVGQTVPEEVKKSSSKNGTRYDAKFRAGNVSRHAIVAENGELLQLEQKVEIAALPAKVRETLERERKGADVKKARAVFVKGAAKVTYYRIELEDDDSDKEWDLEIGPAGEKWQG